MKCAAVMLCAFALLNLTSTVEAASCACKGGVAGFSSPSSPVEDWGDDPLGMTEEEEDRLIALNEPGVRAVITKAGSGETAAWHRTEGQDSPSKVDDVLRVYVERATGYADRDPIWNDSDPYIRLWVRGATGDWTYLGGSSVAEGCNGSDCDAVYNWTMSTTIDRVSLWDVSPEVWDDDGGWSDDELLGWEDFLDIPVAGMALSWRYLTDDSTYRCWEKFSVTYIDNGVNNPIWYSYPTGTVSSALFDWDNPPDRSGVSLAELNLSTDAVFGPTDQYVYSLGGSAYSFSCAGAHPAEGTYYFAVRVRDSAGNWSSYVSPGSTFTFRCPTATPTVTRTPTVTATPTRTPTWTPSPPPTATPTPAETPTPEPVPAQGAAAMSALLLALSLLLLARNRRM